MLNQQLASIIATGKVSHAWLLTGEDNTVREQAQSLAQALLCENLGADGMPCGMCAACAKVKNGNHPDLQIIEPDGASVKIHQTRKMQHFVNLEAFEGGRQVVIIHEAHTMQTAAANSLLKILEEPPQGAYFILTAPVGDSLIQTVLSRVVWVRLHDELDAADSLFRRRREESDLQRDMRKKAVELLKMLDGDLGTLLIFAGSFKEDKKKGVTNKAQTVCFLQQLLLCIREMLAAEYLPESKLLAETVPRVFSGAAALQAAELVEEYIRLANANINTNLLLNVLCFKLQDFHEKQV